MKQKHMKALEQITNACCEAKIEFSLQNSEMLELLTSFTSAVAVIVDMNKTEYLQLCEEMYKLSVKEHQKESDLEELLTLEQWNGTIH